MLYDLDLSPDAVISFGDVSIILALYGAVIGTIIGITLVVAGLHLLWEKFVVSQGNDEPDAMGR